MYGKTIHNYHIKGMQLFVNIVWNIKYFGGIG
jgi:hypothetical protein